jgi:hypothetical protein
MAKTEYKYKRVDPTLKPQVVDFGSQYGWDEGQRKAVGQDLYNRLSGMWDSFGGGGGGGGGGKGGGGLKRLFVDLDELKYDDPRYQAELRRGARGIDEGMYDEMSDIEDLAARTGGGGGGLMEAVAGASRRGRQLKAESGKDTHEMIARRIEDRQAQIAGLQTELDKSWTAGKASLGSARISAAPGHKMANLARMRAPYEIAQGFTNPYAVNFPQAQYLTESQETKTPWWQQLLGGAAQAGLAYATGGAGVAGLPGAGFLSKG